MMRTIRDTTTVYCWLVFLFWFANALPLALLVLLMQERGLNLLQVSLLFGVNALTVVALEVPTGSLADIVGRKRVTAWAQWLMLLGFTLFLTAFSFPVLLLGGVIYGASRALSSGALDAWFIDTVQAHDPDVPLQPLLAKSGVFTLLGLALGTLTGSVLPLGFDRLPANLPAFLTALSLPLVASLLVQLIRLLLIQKLVVEPRPTTQKSLASIATSIPSVVNQAVYLSRESRLIRWLLLTAFAAGFVMVGLENFWQPHFADLLSGGEENTVAFGIIMAGNFVLGAAGNLVSPLLARRFKNQLGILVGAAEFFRGAMLISLVALGNVYLAGLFFWLIYFGMGITHPAVGAMIHEDITADLRSTMLSIQSMVSYIGVFFGSVILGQLAHQFSIGAAWLFAGAVLISLIWPYGKINRYYQQKLASKQAVHGRQNPQPQTG